MKANPISKEDMISLYQYISREYFMRSKTTKHIKRLTIEKYYQALEDLSRVVKYQQNGLGNGSISLVKKENWIAVPFTIDGGFFPKTLSGFVKAAESYNRSEVIATWIEPIDQDLPRAFSVPAILEGVQEFNLDVDLLLMNCAVFAGYPDWVYIWFIDNLDIIYATEPITRIFTDLSVDKAFAAFRTWLDDSPISQITRGHFQSQGTENTLERVYDDLKEFNNAAPGTEVIIDWF